MGRLVGDGGGGWYAGGMILRGDNAGGRGSRPPSDGVTAAMPTGDADCDGDWDATDSADIGSNYTPGSAYAVRRDTDLDGDVDAADVTRANSITGGYQTLGRDVLTSAAVRNRIGYAGYQYDPTFAGVDRHLFHVRFRVYDAEAGRWTRRDPLGYVDGMGLYEYVQGMAIVAADPYGLAGPDGPAEEREKEKKERKKKRKKSLPFDHDKFEAYINYRVRCPGGHVIEYIGWDRVDAIINRLCALARNNCCLEFF